MENSTLLSATSTPSTPPSPKATLTTLPPELLLHIISFLPCSSPAFSSSSSHTSIHPHSISPTIHHHSTILSILLTSSRLHTFISMHLPTIFNTHIRTHHDTTSRYFRPTLLDDWFVPRGGVEGFCERGFRTLLGKEDVENLSRRRRARGKIGGGDGGSKALIGLGTSGPWFARFVEECDFEIKVHVEVVRAKVKAATESTATPTSHGNANIESGTTSTSPAPDEESKDTEKQQEAEEAALLAHPDLAFRLERYCVRPFLLKVNTPKRKEEVAFEVVEVIDERFLEWSWDAGCAGEDNGRRIDGIRDRVRALVKRVVRRRRGKEVGTMDEKRFEDGGRRRLCFGEIEREEINHDDTDDHPLNGDEHDEKVPTWRSTWSRFSYGVGICGRFRRKCRTEPEPEPEDEVQHSIEAYGLGLARRHERRVNAQFMEPERKLAVIAKRRLHSAVEALKVWRGCGGVGGGFGGGGLIGRFEVLE